MTAALITLSVLLAAGLGAMTWERESVRRIPAGIAVLPFENLSPDLAELWFAEGISDVISSQLTKVSGYRVIGRKSTEKFRDKEKNIAEIGDELGVNFIIAKFLSRVMACLYLSIAFQMFISVTLANRLFPCI